MNGYRLTGPTTLLLLVLQGCSKPPPLFVEAATLGLGQSFRLYPLIVDINHDGHPDIVATHREPKDTNGLHIWLGDGQGVFEEIPPTWSSPGYAALAAGDVNHDGHLDLVAASHYSRILTLLGDGQGGFSETVTKTPAGFVAARLVDVNSDKHLDLVTLAWRFRGIEVRTGDGTGKWADSQFVKAGRSGNDLAVGDLNNDGHPDIVAAFGENQVVIYHGDGAGGFSGGPVDITADAGQFRRLALADFDGDEHLDVALNGDWSIPPPFGADVFLADASGGWRQASEGLKAFWLSGWGIAAADLDNDGNADIVQAATQINLDAGGSPDPGGAWGLFMFSRDAKGAWRLRTDSGLPEIGLTGTAGIALGDLNHDGRLDIVTTHRSTGNGQVRVWLRK